MSAFDQVDLSSLPAPDVVEALDFEVILADLLADLRTRWPEFDALLESDPAVKLSEMTAYLALMLRQRVNEAARAVMLPTAVGTDLDNVAALFDVGRQMIDEGDADATPPRAPVFEDDASLRRRVQLSLEAATAAGTKGRYLFYALGAHPLVADAAVTSPAPGEVLISILSRVADAWEPDEALLSAVNVVVQDEDIRALCDLVTVAAAGLLDYTIQAELTFLPGAAAEIALTTAQANVDALIAERRLGRDVTRSALFAALHVAGVQNVNLSHPAADIVVGETEAARCIGATLTAGGVDV